MKAARILGLLFIICLGLSGTDVLAITPLKPYAAIKGASTIPSKPETSSMVASPAPDTADKATVIKSYGKLPLSFERNDGQAPDEVKFLARWGGRVYWFTPGEVVLDFAEKESDTDKMASLGPGAIPEKNLQRHSVRISFPGSNPDVKIEGIEQQEGKANYFIVNDKSRWRTGVPIYRGVIYRNLWPGIDLKYEGRGGNLKYEFVVAPGADPGLIRLAYSGIENMKISDSGELVVSTKQGDLVEAQPVVYQVDNGQKKEIRALYQIMDGNKVGYILFGYNSLLPLVIDPLMYSTYLGGSSEDEGLGIAVDSSGNAYLTGYTDSTNFPTLSPYQGSYAGGRDAFIAKFSPSGQLLFSTYLGGSGDDMGRGIAVDSSGNAYVAGYTQSTDFPALSPYQGSYAGGFWDAFIAKFSPSGQLLFSTYLGGSGWDFGEDIAVDSSGNAYVAGYTQSTDFPALSPYQGSNAGGFDAFIAKFSPSGQLLFSTYLGGSLGDVGYGIAVDSSGNAYVTGMSQRSMAGDCDAFIAKFSPSGQLLFSTYLGGSDIEEGLGIAVDSSGNAYVTGRTGSTNFPTLSPYQGSYAGNTDAFIAKFSPSGQLLFSTYLGGSEIDYGYGIAVDSSGNAYVTGFTGSNNFPILFPYQGSYAGYWDAFIAKFSPSGQLLFSTYLGGSGGEEAYGIVVDSSGNAYVTGSTGSDNFPILFPYQGSRAGHVDVFVAKLDTNLTHASISGSIEDSNGMPLANATLTFSNNGGASYSDATGYYTHLVPIGWSGAVTPGPVLYGFYPAQRLYSNVQSNQTDQDYLVGYRLNLNVSPAGSGTVTPIPQIPTTGLYPLNQSLILIALTNTGYSFSYWSGDASGTANPLLNFMMNSHKSVTAGFQEIVDQLITISGTVKDTSGNPIENADITFVGGNETATVQSNASGYYEKKVVMGWRGTSYARKNGYTFTPETRSYTNITQYQGNQDFTGTPVASERDCRAIIVAGSGRQDDPLWPAINYLGNWTYRALLYKGIARENIRYFNARTYQDVDGNGISTDDIYAPPSSIELQKAILTWAGAYVNENKPLILYLVDHGEDNIFYLSRPQGRPAETLTAGQLDGWLDQLQNARNCKVIVIYDACHSGSFLNDLLPPAGQKRIVIASTGENSPAYFGPTGHVSFSQSFWTSTLMGNHVRKCFLDARSAMAYATNNRQYAMLDDSGDGIWDSHADGQLAQVTYIGDPFVTGALLPEIIERTRDLFLPTGFSHTFYARVQPGFARVERVKGVVVPPGVEGGSTTMPVTDLPTFELSYSASTDRYKGTYSGFAATGTYKITFFAEDTYGNTSLPESTEVQVVGEDGSFPVYRFWSEVFRSHHYTISALERDYILEHWSDAWTYEGIGFYARATGDGGTLPVFRFWSDIFHSHHYTISEWERDYIIATWPEAWTYEGIAFYGYVSPQPGALPVYRFWSEIYHSHHYTISDWERDYIIRTWPEAWTYEGIAFYMYVAP